MKYPKLPFLKVLVLLTAAGCTEQPDHQTGSETREAARALLLKANANEPAAALTPPSQPNSHGIAVIDREIRHIQSPDAGRARSAPTGESSLVAAALSPLPRQIEVPFEWGRENLYMGAGRSLTGNLYQEPGKPWILHLGISTPGAGDSKTGSPQYKVWYRVSDDGGKTASPLRQAIVEGEAYNSMHPIDGVWVGKNGYNVDATRPVVRAGNGEIMVPVGLHVLGENGELYNPHQATSFQDAGVLIGNWKDDGRDVRWSFGEWIRVDPERSTRGLSEPSIAEVEEGVFLLVARGANATKPDLPCNAWFSISEDYCRTWSEPQPFTYADGASFFSPAACSTLIRSSKNGRIYWIGNITPENPDSSLPRYPLVIGEVDKERHGLIRESVVLLDTRHPDHDKSSLQLSNFRVFEDRETGNLIVTVTRIDGMGRSRRVAGAPSWYLIGLPNGTGS